MKRILTLIALCVLNPQILTANCVTPPAGLVSWWRGETNALDWAGTNNGILEGNVGFAPGEVGQGFALNGVDAYVQIAASSGLNVGSSGGLTIETWIKPTVAGYFPVVEWNSGAQDGVHLWLNGGGALYVNLRDTALNAH